MTLDGRTPAQISRNLGHFWYFCTKNRVFLPVRRATWRALFLGSSKWKKIYISGFGMKNHDCWCMAKKFGKILSPQKVKKHSNNDLTAPILTHRKQSWEIEVLEGKMDTKLKNSTWVGK